MMVSSPARCTPHGWAGCDCIARRQQTATIGQLAAELVDAVDRGDSELARCFDQAISRALKSPEAAAAEQLQLDQQDDDAPHAIDDAAENPRWESI